MDMWILDRVSTRPLKWPRRGSNPGSPDLGAFWKLLWQSSRTIECWDCRDRTGLELGPSLFGRSRKRRLYCTAGRYQVESWNRPARGKTLFIFYFTFYFYVCSFVIALISQLSFLSLIKDNPEDNNFI